MMPIESRRTKSSCPRSETGRSHRESIATTEKGGLNCPPRNDNRSVRTMRKASLSLRSMATSYSTWPAATGRDASAA